MTTPRAGYHRNHALAIGRGKTSTFSPNHSDSLWRVHTAFYRKEAQGSFPRSQSGRAVELTTQILLSPRIRVRESITPNLPTRMPSCAHRDHFTTPIMSTFGLTRLVTKGRFRPPYPRNSWDYLSRRIKTTTYFENCQKGKE